MTSTTLWRGLLRQPTALGGSGRNPTLAPRRCFRTAPRCSLPPPSKYDQDKDSINTESNEYSKSGGDSTSSRAAAHAAFDADKTRPETEYETARSETGSDSNNPLNVSPANVDIGKPRGSQEGGAQGSEGETGHASARQRTSGGWSAAKAGGAKSG